MTDHAPESYPPVRPTPLSVVADHWGLVLAYGLASLGLGLALALWPGETLKVVAILIGIQFLVAGVVRIISAVAATALAAPVRILLAITGALALIVGLLCLRDPLQTLLALGILLGAWWIASGVIDIVGAVLGHPGRRVWDVLGGFISILAGGFLLIDPHLSLGVLVFVTSIWLLATGLVSIVTALRLRRLSRDPSAAL